MPTVFHPHEYEPTGNAENTRLLNSDSKYGSTHQANPKFSAQNVKQRSNKCRFIVVAALFGTLALILFIDRMISTRKKSVDLEISSLSAATAPGEPEMTETSMENGNSDDESASTTGSGSNEESAEEDSTQDSHKISKKKAAKLYEKYLSDMLAAGRYMEKILRKAHMYMRDPIKSRKKILREWQKYKDLQDRATESLRRFEEYTAKHKSHEKTLQPAAPASTGEPNATIPIKPAGLGNATTGSMPSSDTGGKNPNGTNSSDWHNYNPDQNTTNVPDWTKWTNESSVCVGSSGVDMGCCIHMQCGKIVGEIMENASLVANMAKGFMCLDIKKNVSSCFGNIAAAEPLMKCLSCNNCIGKPKNLNCTSSEHTFVRRR